MNSDRYILNTLLLCYNLHELKKKKKNTNEKTKQSFIESQGDKKIIYNLLFKTHTQCLTSKLGF